MKPYENGNILATCTGRTLTVWLIKEKMALIRQMTWEMHRTLKVWKAHT